jgi:MurNAc alpha-1-phosphate uridylyltransferase
MGPLTESLPKPLLDLNGCSLIGRQLRRLAAAGICDVVINLSYRGDLIRDAVGDGSRFGVRAQYAEEGPEPLETAGGIINALPLLGDAPFLVINADVVSDFDFGGLALAGTLGALVLVPNPPHSPRGDYALDAESLLTHGEPKFTFSGISLLSPSLFSGLAPGRRPLSEVFDTAIGERRLTGRLHTGLWFDVGTADRLAAAAAAVARQEAV